METRTIPEDRWSEFFDRFSRDHFGWTATVEVLDPGAGAQHVAENLPLQGISLDTKGTRACTIALAVGDDPDAHINHVVERPLHIREAQEADGSVDLQIQPAEGPVTLLHLHGPVH